MTAKLDARREQRITATRHAAATARFAFLRDDARQAIDLMARAKDLAGKHWAEESEAAYRRYQAALDASVVKEPGGGLAAMDPRTFPTACPKTALMMAPDGRRLDPIGSVQPKTLGRCCYNQGSTWTIRPMESAIDLFRAGLEVMACETDHAAASTMRTVCPRCRELVHLVVRDTGSYFSHQPQTGTSPPCALRVDSGGAARAHGGPHKPLPPNTRFRDALLMAYSLAEPPRPPSDGAGVAQAASIMHRVHRSQGRTVTASDLPGASPMLRDWWRNDAEMIRGILNHPGVVARRLRDSVRDHCELKTSEHRQSVLLLWKHLHSPQVADDLLLLLHTTIYLFGPLLLADLVATSLGVLAWVPWSALWTESACGECGRAFRSAAGEKPDACSECGKDLCPECVNSCSGCGDVLCEHCIFDVCSACGDSLCMTCSHHDWECAWCSTSYCEGGWHGEVREEVGKTECADCGEAFCDDCADSALEDVDGEWVCESCRDERAGDYAAALEEAGRH